MVQYLLNATIIWLLSLFVFDLFLRRETFHNYNRIYLLGTFIMGMVLPLVSVHKTTTSYAHNITHRIETANNIKHHIVAYATTSHLNTQHLLWIAYLAGVVISMSLLLLDIGKLLKLFRNGHKWKEGNWTIITTGGEHAPFSLFRMVFVSDMHQYSDAEWQIVLKHEQQHGQLLHFADMFLMQVARIIFWFHPLVYAYNSRLLMVHEYQADKAVTAQPNTYAHFLISQSMLRTAPRIAHTLNRSPIKKRIVMLTHHSKRATHMSKLLVIPMTLLFLAFCTKSLYSQGKTDNAISAAVPSGTDTLHTSDNHNTAHDASSKQTTRTDSTQKKTIPFMPMPGGC